MLNVSNLFICDMTGKPLIVAGLYDNRKLTPYATPIHETSGHLHTEQGSPYTYWLELPRYSAPREPASSIDWLTRTSIMFRRVGRVPCHR